MLIAQDPTPAMSCGNLRHATANQIVTLQMTIGTVDRSLTIPYD